MTTKELLLEQFTTCFDQNGWFVAIHNAIDGLTAVQAGWKPNETENSIWETLGHLTFYNNAYVERFKGVDYKYPTDDNDETFVAGSSDEEWRAEVERFDAVMNEFRDLIAVADESKFSTQVSETNKASWATLISNINAHNAYHAGQILLTRKLQGTWNPKKGVS
jgi:uncharacterized damage-inducible protein DinB